MIIRLVYSNGTIAEIPLNKDLIFDVCFLNEDYNLTPDTATITIKINVNEWTGTYKRLVKLNEEDK